MTNKQKYTLRYIAFALLIALTGAFFYFGFEQLYWSLCEAYMPRLAQNLTSLLIYVPVLFAGITAWSVAIFIGWFFGRKLLFFGEKTQRNKLRTWRWCRLSFFASLLDIAWCITAKSALGWQISYAKIIGGLLFVLLLLAFARPYVFSMNTPKEQQQKFSRFCRRFLVSEIKPFKHLKNAYLSSLLRFVGLVWVLITPLFAYLTAEFIHFADTDSFILFFNADSPDPILFSLLILYSLYAVVLLLVKRGWIASLLLSFALTGASIADYFKFSMTGDNFYPWDLVQQGKNVGEVLDFVTIGLPPVIWALIIVEIVMIIISALSRVGIPARIQVRVPAAIILAACLFSAVSTQENTSAFLERHGITASDMILQQTNYVKNGFTTAFSLNILGMNTQKPDDYSQEHIDSLLNGYHDKPAEESFSSPDIILILSESFWDPRALPNTTFSSNPLPNFDEIASRENAYSGKFYVSVHGGGTVRTEFEVLTSMTSDYLPSGAVPWQYVKRDIPSYVSLFKSLGYHTLSVHPYLSSFYTRKETYPFVGFDEMYFADDLTPITEVENEIRGLQTSDQSFVNYLEYFLDKDEAADTSAFVFGISMENHAPYEGKYSEHAIQVDNPSLSENSMANLSNYVQGISDTDQSLKMLTDYIDNRDKDTILVFFGDHLPYLGYAYSDSGVITSFADITPEQAKTMFATPFLIYSNFDMQKSNIVSKGTDNIISSYELMNAACQLMGAPQTRFMQLMSDFYDAIPYYNIRLGIEPSNTALQYINAQRLITYDILNGKQYSVNK